LSKKVFFLLAAIGTVVHILYYLPWFRTFNVELAFLSLLRTLSLGGPLYIRWRGKRISSILNLTLISAWVLSTTWHVCYFVYL